MKRMIVLISFFISAAAAIMAAPMSPDSTKPQVATFAGGCFWSLQAATMSILPNSVARK